MEDVLVPIGMFTAITVMVSLFYWFRYRARGEMQKTIRTAIEKGQELSPEIIDRLGSPPAPRDRDFRLAMLWLAIAGGLALCGWAVPDPSGYALQGCLAGAAFPFAIGIAFVILWRFGEHKQ